MVGIAAGWRRTVGVRTDGTVLATGRRNEGACDVADWSEVVAVSAGDWHTVGLRADGTVVA
ncbi:RCC1 domain-containing protein, partial [Neisseria gonorrhoeae]|uniref:RCC1 domain-containing protein n=1 Tax=Neisseria gonorrhoeae TaxID=485 RepID=UPI0031200B1B